MNTRKTLRTLIALALLLTITSVDSTQAKKKKKEALTGTPKATPSQAAGSWHRPQVLTRDSSPLPPACPTPQG